MTLRDELQSVWDIYLTAYRRGDARGCASVFTPDALLMSPFAPPARGRKQIEVLHADWTLDGGGSKKIDMIEFRGTADLAWCLCRFSEGEATGEGTSVNILERQPDGPWLIRMCSLNEGASLDA